MRQKEKSTSVDSGSMMAPPWKKLFGKKTARSSREESTRASSSGEASSPVKPAVSSARPSQSGTSRDKSLPVVEQIEHLNAVESVLDSTKQNARPELQKTPYHQALSPMGKREKMTKARAILSRPFSRNSIPHRHGQRDWVVEVSPAEWDADQSRWKYRILLQRRQLQPHSENALDAEVGTATSFTSAFTWRSLADFAWLEEALRAEYHGALLLPLLNIAIGTPDLASTQYEVDAALLRDWFGDVLNGIRGQGEVVIDQGSVDLMSSEALEAFLYRNTDPLPIVSSAKHMQSQSLLPSVSTLDLPWKDSPETDARDSSFVSSLWLKPFNVCANFDGLCVAGTPTSPDDGHQEKPRVQQISMDLMRAHCSSRALESTPSLEIQDSFVQYEHGELDSSNLAIQPQLVDAESELIEFYRRSCLSAMERLRLLKEEESLVTGAWKRFAISLSNLYSYEKEVEGSRVGEAKENKDNMPYRKLVKSTVDELLRILARQKLDRSVSSLAIIDSMLRAYVGDLSAVMPSVKSYSEAVSQLTHIDDLPVPPLAQKAHHNEGGTGWQATIKSLYGMVEMTKHDSLQTATTTGSSAEGDVLSQRKAFENRVFTNERLLRESLTAMCRATPIRCARIAHHFLTAEEIQATMLSSAAISLRTKINIADQEILEEIKNRHSQESALDDVTEMALVHRLLNLGNFRMSEKKPVSFPVEIGEGSHSEEVGKASSRDRVLQLAQDRLGKWDSELALALMEAVGIDDAEVQLEETTRDLRLVRRHAIGLRENLSRCLEALSILKAAILYGQHDILDSPTLVSGFFPTRSLLFF